jgi:hypothetical protein
MASKEDKKKTAELAVVDTTVPAAISFGEGQDDIGGSFVDVELAGLWFINEPGAVLCFVPLERSEDVSHLFESKYPGDKSPTYVWTGVITQPSNCRAGKDPRIGQPGEIVSVIESARLKKQFAAAAKEVACIRLTSLDKVDIESKKYGGVKAWEYRLQKYAPDDAERQAKMRKEAEKFREEAKRSLPTP